MSENVLPLKQVQLVSEKRSNILNSQKSNNSSIKLSKIKPELSDNALRVISKRYLVKDRHRQPLETPEDMFHRVAKHIAQADKMYGANETQILKTENDFYEIMARLEFLPNSPTFTGAGTKIGQLSACFVLPIEDDMTAILKTQMDMGLIHKSGGGTGFSFSRLRPKNDVVGTTGGISSGPMGFLQMYNDTTETIKQGGTRRGANMGILRVDHPDILDFIAYKEKEGTLNNFNLSVALTADFMKALEKDAEYDLINPRDKKVIKSLKAADVFQKIVDGAWQNGEPGIIFLDKINAKNPTPILGEIEATNPCGEQPLMPYESCNLGAINLKKFVKYTHGKPEVDFEMLDKIIPIVVHFMDNVIDVNKYPISEIEEMTKLNRKIGITVMGFADMLYKLGVPYDSEEGLDLADKIMGFIKKRTHEESANLAKIRGAFPNFEKSIWNKSGAPKMRNAATTSCNPTGTLSIIGTCSSGIEPFFALAYVKTVMDNDALPEVNEHFMEVLKSRNLDSPELMKKISEKGSIQDLDEIPDDLKNIFKVASDIAPDWHVKMQAVFQKHTDGAISKTINFANSATREEIEKAYLLAYKLNCKGLTVYRDGSRNVQILTTGTEKKEIDNKETQTIVAPASLKITPRERPDIIRGFTYRIKTAYGKLFITINDDENGQPFEIFSHLGKAGGFFAAKAEAICRLISLALRSGIAAEEIIDQLKGIRGPTPTWNEEGKMVLSMPDAIAQILEKHISKAQADLGLEFKTAEQPALENIDQLNSELTETIIIKEPPKKSLADLGEAPACPDCGAMLEFTEGCLKCSSCGFSKCG